MNRTWILLAVVTCPLVVLAQTGSPGTPRPAETPYQPAVPAATTVNAYGGYPGYSSGGGTAAGNAMNGMASVISAKGNYNLSTSAAAINMTQAQKNEIQNRQLYTDTYFQMRETNRKARAAEAGPNPTMEQIARMARQGVPKPLGPSQMDPVNGQLNWPDALQDADFADQRGELEQLFATRARYGGLNYADQSKVMKVVDTMFDELKKQVRDIPPQDYVACRSFLSSIKYAATKTEVQ
jgi:hypothetical protein